MRFFLPIPRRKWSRRIALALMGAAAWGVSDVWEGYVMYQETFDRAMSVSAIVSYDEMQRLSAVPPEQNAAALLADPFQRFDAVRQRDNFNLRQEVDRYSSDIRSPLPFDSAKVREFLEPYTAILDDLAPSLTKSRCDFGFDWSKGYSLTFSELYDASSLARLLCMRARLRMREGKFADGLTQFRIARHLANLLYDTPVDIAYDSALRAEQRCLQAMQECIADHPENRMVRNELRKLAGGLRTSIDWPRLMMANLYFAWSSAEYPEQWIYEDYPCGQCNNLRAVAWIPGVQQAWRTRVLEHLIAVKQAETNLRGEPLLATPTPHRDAFGISYLLAKELYLAPIRLQDQMVLRTVRQQLLFALIDVLNFRDARGAWPKELPIDRLDSFSLQPLRYIKQGNEISIYSIGPNTRDQWKAKREKDSRERADDVGLVLSVKGR